MSSSTTTRTIPSVTPHLRAVRSRPTDTDTDRWRTPSVPRPIAVQPAPLPQPAPAVLAALPEGAVVAALPPSTLPQALLARYSAELGAPAGQPLVGYLVLVPAEHDQQPTAVASAPAAPARQALQPAEHGITVDTDRRHAYVDGSLLDLTYLEFELLAHLTAHPHRVHARDHLVSAVWGYSHIGDGRTVDVHVARLRRKLGVNHRESIVTVRRIGYKYSPTS